VVSATENQQEKTGYDRATQTQAGDVALLGAVEPVKTYDTYTINNNKSSATA